MFGGIKITLILCLTIIVSCVLFISYNEYTNRYTLLSTNDNVLYIFDKKSVVLNRCDGKGCALIETKLPTKTSMNFEPNFQQSKLFESDKPVSIDSKEKKKEESPKTVEARPEKRKGLIDLEEKEPTSAAKKNADSDKEEANADNSKDEEEEDFVE